MRLGSERERQQGMVFEDNMGGLYDKKVILHDKMWGVFTNGEIFN